MNKPNEFVKKEDARVGYEVAASFWTYQGQLNWHRYNVMLVSNSVMLAVIGATLSSQRLLPYLTLALAIVGLILCFVWVLLTARGFDHHKFWGLCAWELERHLGDEVKTVSKLQVFAKGDNVSFKVHSEETDKEDTDKDEVRNHRFGRLSNVLSQKPLAFIVVAAFAVSYVVMVVFSFLLW
jgi:hypothetical protein